MANKKTKKSIKWLKQIKSCGVKRSLIQLEKELDIYSRCNGRKFFLKKIVTKQLNKKRKVQIGGGNHYLPGFINIDICDPADIIYDVRDNIPLPPNSVDLIFSEHFLEHIDYPNSVAVFFRESYRILNNGGKLIIGVPDSEKIIRAYIDGDKKYLNKIKNNWYKKRKIFNEINCDLDLVNLVIRDEDANVKYSPHYWGYGKDGLIKLFKKFGFKKIREWKFDKKIANKKRRFGSIYIEGLR